MPLLIGGESKRFSLEKILHMRFRLTKHTDKTGAFIFRKI